MPIIGLRAQATGTATSTAITITLPTYLTSDYIVLIVASNNGNAPTFGANVTATAITDAGDRLAAYRIVPQDGAQTSFTLTVGVSSVFTWWIASYTGIDASATAYGTNNQIGNSTLAQVAILPVTTGYITTGNELVLSAAAVNSTATWATTGNTLYATTSGNAALQVQGAPANPGHIATAPATMDRGNDGSSRNQNSLAIVLQPVQAPLANLLANGSFELGTTVATGWQTETTLAGTPTWTVQSAAGVVDGASAQRLQYTGQGGDASRVVEIFQAPIAATPGRTLRFGIWLRGTQTNCAALVGIEAFTAGNAYISETDAYLTLTPTSTRYVVDYACPPGTDHVAAYVQFNEVGPTSVIDAYMDLATLTTWDGTTPAPLRQVGATVTQIAAAMSSTQLFAARAAGQRLVYNDSTAVLYLKFGTAASATSYTVQVPPGGRFEFPGGVYDDTVHGVWTAANGFAYCTEVSD